MNIVKITVYAGFDWRSRLAVRVAREAGLYISRTYGIPIEVEVIELPLGDLDASSEGVPVVIVGGHEVSAGDVPSIVDIVDTIFNSLEEEFNINTKPFSGLIMV